MDHHRPETLVSYLLFPNIHASGELLCRNQKRFGFKRKLLFIKMQKSFCGSGETLRICHGFFIFWRM
jgi:hypothetical protein